MTRKSEMLGIPSNVTGSSDKHAAASRASELFFAPGIRMLPCKCEVCWTRIVWMMIHLRQLTCAAILIIHFSSSFGKNPHVTGVISALKRSIRSAVIRFIRSLTRLLPTCGRRRKRSCHDPDSLRSEAPCRTSVSDETRYF